MPHSPFKLRKRELDTTVGTLRYWSCPRPTFMTAQPQRRGDLQCKTPLGSEEKLKGQTFFVIFVQSKRIITGVLSLKSEDPLLEKI